MPAKPRSRRDDQSKRANPYVHVAFQAKDLFGVERQGGGGTESSPDDPHCRERRCTGRTRVVE